MEFSATLILAGLVLAFFWFMLWNRKYNLPPGPTALPLVGNLPQLDKNQPFKSFTEVSYEKNWNLLLGECVILYNFEVKSMFREIFLIVFFPVEQSLWPCYDTVPGLAAYSSSDRIRCSEGGSGGPGWWLYRQRATAISPKSYQGLR